MTMMLNIIYDGYDGWRHPEGAVEIREAIAEILAKLTYEDLSARGVSPGNQAQFSLADRLFDSTNVQNLADFSIIVSANRSTGYGAMVWYTTHEDVPSDDTVWISNNPQPPAFDPRVVADPHYPLFHSPSSAVPLIQVQAALEEFCLDGSGARPAVVDWVQGDLSGRRDDEEHAVDFVEVPDDPWAL